MMRCLSDLGLNPQEINQPAMVIGPTYGIKPEGGHGKGFLFPEVDGILEMMPAVPKLYVIEPDRDFFP